MILLVVRGAVRDARPRVGEKEAKAQRDVARDCRTHNKRRHTPAGPLASAFRI